jgi:hypothetical protein
MNAATATGLASTHQDVPRQACRDLVAQLEAHLPGRVSALPIWIDGAWKDYWYVTLDGESVGDIYYDSFGPVIKGDALGTLVYQANRAAEIATVEPLPLEWDV